MALQLPVLLPRFYRKIYEVARGQLEVREERSGFYSPWPTVLTGQPSITRPIPEEPFN